MWLLSPQWLSLAVELVPLLPSRVTSAAILVNHFASDMPNTYVCTLPVDILQEYSR